MRLNWNVVFGFLVAGFAWQWTEMFAFDVPWWGTFLIFLVSQPVEWKDNTYSLWGGWSQKGNVYSLIGIIQVAGKEAGCFFGLTLWQEAHQDTFQIIGISLFQRSDHGDAFQMLGISVLQIARDDAQQMVGISGLQIGHETVSGFGVSLFQHAGRLSAQGVGLSLYQKSRVVSQQFFGFNLFTHSPKLEKQVAINLIHVGKKEEVRQAA